MRMLDATSHEDWCSSTDPLPCSICSPKVDDDGDVYAGETLRRLHTGDYVRISAADYTDEEREEAMRRLRELGILD